MKTKTAQLRKKEKKRREVLKRQRQYQAEQVASHRVMKQLLNVFGENATAMLNMASRGESPETIAETLDVPLAQVEQFIEQFTRLPHGFDELLLRAPSLLAKERPFQSMVRAAIEGAKAERRTRPW